MADMTLITTSVDNVSYNFLLAEVDINALTFRAPAITDTIGQQVANYAGYQALVDAHGINLNFRAPGDPFRPGIFDELVTPTGGGDYGFVRPTGKTLLARAATLLAVAARPWPNVVLATLTLALRGGGMTRQAAVDVAQVIARSPKSSAGKFNYVQSVLVPQILNAAAAA